MSQLVFYDLPDTLQEDMKVFFDDIKSYQKEEINTVKFKGIRVVHGIYEQRKPETHMVRIRCAGGGVTPQQLKRVAELSRQYGSGEVHVTTRQDLQLHYVPLNHVPEVCLRLCDVGISPRGGGGNTVRNVLASHDSGVHPDEVFDVMPYAESLTSRMLKEADSWNLPRKFKIAFCNTSIDNVRSAITCLGFFASIKDGRKGFKVYCAGGMGNFPMLGHCLFEFVEDRYVYHVVKAIKVMFDKYGNRRNRNKAKLKFLWDKLGKDDFIQKFRFEYDQLIQIDGLELVFKDYENKNQVEEGHPVVPLEESDRNEFNLWKKRYVTVQKQEELYQINVPLKLGDLQAEEALIIAEGMIPFGENTIRLSVSQNIYLRNIPEIYLSNLFYLLKKIDTLSFSPRLFSQMVACTGADTCKLGIALPRGVTPRIQSLLNHSIVDLLDELDVKIHISGCPNTCGCHHSADLGFFGRILRSGKDMMPAYNVMVGAIMIEGQSRFSRKVGEIATKDMPEFIRDVLQLYSSKNYLNFAEYVDNEGEEEIKNICLQYQNIPSFEKNPAYFYDWGSSERFSLLKGQKAECSAGMFDMIDVDVAQMKKDRRSYEESDSLDLKKENISNLLFCACRMLLVTRGIEAKDNKDVFRMFQQHFINSHIVPKEFSQIVEKAQKGHQSQIYDQRNQVLELSDFMLNLYKNMDDSLRFPHEATEELKKESALSYSRSDKMTKKEAEESQEFFKDLRGVGCPINFVKVKLELAKLKSKDKLLVFLDNGAPISNVPASVQAEGHTILKKEQVDDHYWMVKIEKK